MATLNFDDKIEQACEKIKNAKAILLGGGAGLSTAAGLDYSGPGFQANFADYISKYGFPDLYTSSFYEFPSEEERWARWARHVEYARFRPEAFLLYRKLYQLVAEKEYFVITTNVDGQFIKAGFGPDKVFEVQGDYGYMQCASGCHPKVYSNEALVHEMVEKASDFKIPESLVPHCPVCGGNMDIHVRKNNYFVEDANWEAAADRYEQFITKYLRAGLLLMELGVGFNTPGIIRRPFEEMTLSSPAAFLIRINYFDDHCPKVLSSRVLIFQNDINEVIDRILLELKK